MSYMIGADVQELRDLAAAFRAKASQLRTMESNLNYRINSAPWHGHDVTKFVHDWNSAHRRQILSIAAQIETAAGTVSVNADQQQQASQAGYAGGIASLAALEAAQKLRNLGVPDSTVAVLLALFSAAPAVVTDVGRVLDFAKSLLEVPVGTISGGGNVVTVLEAMTKDANVFKVSDKEIRAIAKAADKASPTLKVFSKVAKFLAPVSAVLDGMSLNEDMDNGQTGDAIFNGIALGLDVAGTVALIPPLDVAIVPLAVAGLVVTGVQAVYDMPEVKTWVNGEAAQAGKVAVAGAQDVVHGAQVGVKVVTDAGASAIHQAEKTYNSVVDAGKSFVNSVFRKPSWL